MIKKLVSIFSYEGTAEVLEVKDTMIEHGFLWAYQENRTLGFAMSDIRKVVVDHAKERAE